ncbi:MAG: hypothetical protein PHO91_03420 [Patescibacteria group bacterium]|nr:hypothetical protein [Patescibacteria group bacterium]
MGYLPDLLVLEKEYRREGKIIGMVKSQWLFMARSAGHFGCFPEWDIRLMALPAVIPLAAPAPEQAEPETIILKSASSR